MERYCCQHLRVPESYLKDFINQKENWILKKLDEVKNRRKKEITYENGDEIIFLGEKKYLEIINSSFEKVVVKGEKLYILLFGKFNY